MGTSYSLPRTPEDFLSNVDEMDTQDAGIYNLHILMTYRITSIGAMLDQYPFNFRYKTVIETSRLRFQHERPSKPARANAEDGRHAGPDGDAAGHGQNLKTDGGGEF